MSTVASRDLRNHTADVLRRVANGDEVSVTVHGKVVAKITPVRESRRQSMTRLDLTDLLATKQTDAGLRGDLARLAGETTDDLGPVR